MRRKIAAGNWKMNTTVKEGIQLLENLASHKTPDDSEMIIFAPATHLSNLRAVTPGHIAIGAQNMYYEDKGAYTGEVSPLMLLDLEIDYVLIGHSERREYFNETNTVLAKKVDKALEHNLKPVFCCGEPLAIRKDGTHVSYVKTQLEEGIFHLSKDKVAELVIAYEPIWAIGTGETASPSQAQEMHKAIRSMIADKYDDNTADSLAILYGGSVKPANAEELFSQSDVDGGLVGGASLNAEGFAVIANSF